MRAMLARPWLCLALVLPLGTLATEDRPGRLPQGVTPLHYEIRIEPDAQALTFHGRAIIDLEVRDATREITLNAVDLEIPHAELDGVPVSGIEIDAAGQVVRVELAEPVAPGRHRLSIDYSGRIYTSAMGLFAVDYDGPAGKRRMLTSQFQVADARRFAPMWDEPAAKATFALEVVVPVGQSAYSNMPVIDTRIDGDRQSVRFATSPRMSSYLLHLSVGEFDRLAQATAGVDSGIVTRRGAAETGRFALEATARILPWFNDYFGTPYPLPKLDQIAVPGSSQFFGAMENWGAIMYFEPYLLVDPKRSSISDRRTVFVVVAHEVAHQWFGNLVTMEWWDDLWLNESFASWMEGKIEAALLPDNKPALQFVNDTREFALRRDASAATRPIVRPVPSVEAANQAFDAISYSKGPAVLNMLEDFLGEAGFRDGIRRYMRAYAFRNAVTDQLWAELAAATGQPVKEIAQDFTLQPGVPMVTVETAACRDGRTPVTLAQQRFETGAKDPRRYTWMIPVRIRSTDVSAVTTIQLGRDGKPVTAEVPGCGAVVANAGQAGYFRTKYAEPAFERLRAAFDELSEVDRLGLLNDTWSLGEAGEVPVTSYLDLAAVVAADSDPLILLQLTRTLVRIDRLFDGSPAQEAWRIHARARLQPAFARVGWLPAADEGDNVGLLREELIGALGRLEDPAVLVESRQRFGRAVQSPEALPPAIRSAVIQVVASHADAATWMEIRRRAAAATEPVAKQELWRALGAARDPVLAARTLEFAISPEAPRDSAVAMIAQVSYEHPELGFDFAARHEKNVLDLVEASSQHSFIPLLAAQSFDPAMIEKVRAYAERSLPADARRSADIAMADIRYRADVRAKQLPVLERWVGSMAAT
jgi:aminopeptidase N